MSMFPSEIDAAMRAYRRAKKRPNPWLRLVHACLHHRGVMLDSVEVLRLLQDDAIQTAALTGTEADLGEDWDDER